MHTKNHVDDDNGKFTSYGLVPNSLTGLVHHHLEGVSGYRAWEKLAAAATVRLFTMQLEVTQKNREMR